MAKMENSSTHQEGKKGMKEHFGKSVTPGAKKGGLAETGAIHQLCLGARLAIATSQPEHITNLAIFGLDHKRSQGSGLDWNWRSAGGVISLDKDPARPPSKGCNSGYLHWKLKRHVEHIYFRLLAMLLILVDISLVITELAISCPTDPTSKVLRILDLVLSSYFIFEVFLRLVALTPQVFFSKSSWHNIIDFFIVLLTFATTLTSYFIIQHHLLQYNCSTDTEWSDLTTLLSFGRLVRLIRFVRLVRIYFEHRNVVRGVRHLISENKRRYEVDGYDLDLTYITTNIIAMSFPSKGKAALYRNKIESVARFFDEKHADENKINFMIYDLCSEQDYDVRPFHGHVRRYPIDDHNVPAVSQMQDLVDDASEWLKGEMGRVVAIHCKGGKGRTGTMICALLIDQGLFKDAAKSLHYFGERRTDYNVGKHFQGVETYSQIRYVHYFQKMQSNSLKTLPSSPLMVTNITLTGLRNIGKGNGSDFVMTIFNKDQVLVWNFSCPSNCSTTYNPTQDRLDIELKIPPTVDSDTKFMFENSSSSVPRGYDNCAFFFWLHTFFIEKDCKEGVEDVRHVQNDCKNPRTVEKYSCEEEGGLKVILKREVLDNPHKRKSWDVWREDFSVEVRLSEVSKEKEVKEGSEVMEKEDGRSRVAVSLVHEHSHKSHSGSQR